MYIRTPLRRFAPWALGLGAMVLSLIGAGIPAYWGDEAASVMSATRPLDTLWPALANVDAVHGLYYVFLHGWVQLFGISEAATRFPSAVAIGLATAGLWLLVSRLSGPRIATLSAGIFAILPRVTLDGIETRGYAFAVAGIVWTAYLFICLYQAPRRRYWMYGLWSVVIALSCLVFMYTALILPTIFLWLLLSRRRWWAIPWTVLYGAIGIVLASPVVLIAVTQRGQINFLAQQPPTVSGILIHQWFGNRYLALLAWSLIAIAVIAAIHHARKRDGDEARVTAFFVLWLVVPPVMLGLISIFSPSYALRYLVIGAPAAAVLMALGVRALVRVIPAPRIVTALILVVLIAAAAAPDYLRQRTPTDKNDTDLRAVAEYVEQGAKPGDTILFDQGFPFARQPRVAIHLYTEAFEGLRDPGLVTPYERTDALWDVTRPVTETAIDPASTAVWLAARKEQQGVQTMTQADLASLKEKGFEVVDSLSLDHTVMYHLVRRTP